MDVIEPKIIHIQYIYRERDTYIQNQRERERRDSGMYTLHNTELEERERARKNLRWNETNEIRDNNDQRSFSFSVPPYATAVSSNDQPRRYANRSRAASASQSNNKREYLYWVGRGNQGARTRRELIICCRLRRFRSREVEHALRINGLSTRVLARHATRILQLDNVTPRQFPAITSRQSSIFSSIAIK